MSVVIKPKNRENARALLAAAEVAELDPSVVVAVRDGFSVPEEVADIFNGADAKPAAKKKAASTKAKAKAEADEPQKEGAEE